MILPLTLYFKISMSVWRLQAFVEIMQPAITPFQAILASVTKVSFLLPDWKFFTMVIMWHAEVRYPSAPSNLHRCIEIWWPDICAQRYRGRFCKWKNKVILRVLCLLLQILMNVKRQVFVVKMQCASTVTALINASVTLGMEWHLIALSAKVRKKMCCF